MDLGDRADDFRFPIRDRPASSPPRSTRLLRLRHPGREDPATVSTSQCPLERFVGTVRLLILNERHLRAVLNRCANHYNHRTGHISTRRRPVLGGLIDEYEPTAAQPQVRQRWSTSRTAPHRTSPSSPAWGKSHPANAPAHPIERKTSLRPDIEGAENASLDLMNRWRVAAAMLVLRVFMKSTNQVHNPRRLVE
ncbi:hypothetical protein AB0I91_21840 [Actinosynnema sp. NPDC049800]